MYGFEYTKASSADQAATVLKGDEDAKVLAGGMTFIPTLKARLAMPSQVIDLNGVPELAGIVVTDSAVKIGAMTRHTDVAANAQVQAAIPALAHLAGNIGDPMVRNRGTMGGSVANADPAACYPSAVLGLGATVHTTARDISGDDFFTGMFETALEDGELITAITFPRAHMAAYIKFPNPASRYAMVGVFASKGPQGVRVGVTGAAPSAFRFTAAEEALAANFSPDALSDVSMPADDLNADMHASADYRASLVVTMTKRAVSACLA
ncbi:MAG: xanthine dehydrogenase family protein subunit M [Pseudomonadota bacterium]